MRRSVPAVPGKRTSKGILLDELTEMTRKLIAALERGDVTARRGYLVGLDRPALLAPDAGALLAAQRPEDIIAQGHRWRVVTEPLWRDLLDLGRERPEQQVFAITIADIESWLDDPAGLSDLDRDGWRGNQGTMFVLPITW